MSQTFDVVIENGLFFDGRGNPAAIRHVGIDKGVVTAISESPLPRANAQKVVDATGCWVTPGFIDIHTHYDAEVELSPSLSESVRHGVTTVMLGSCSLSLALGTPEDLADMFCRVEAIPYEVVRDTLEAKKNWNTVGDYFAHLDELNLGPNVASFLGHSAVRAHVLGLERSLDKRVKPTGAEMQQMEGILNEALDLGYLGLSIQTLPWDKMGGTRDIRSRPLPSTFARWSEYRRLNRTLRERGRVFQGVPNISTKVNVALFYLESIGLFRKPLKTTIISMMDIRASRGIHRIIGSLTRFVNRFLDGNFKFQALPEIFDLWADGIDLVVFEEFGAGAAALHLEDQLARSSLLRDPVYRARFRNQWTSRFLPRAFHRDFNQSEILACPDSAVVGKSFAQLAKEQGRHAVDVFLDLVAEHGTKLRWYTVMGNDRPQALEEIVTHPDILIGFSDAGAHLRQMSHYNFPLRLLKLVNDAKKNGREVMPLERAVHRLTGELGEWLGIDAGMLGVGKRADVVVVDPSGLDGAVDAVEEAPVEGFRDDFRRLVRRNPKAIRSVLINGREAVQAGEMTPVVGRERGFGRVLKALS